MTKSFVLICLAVPVLAFAQPGGSAGSSAGSSAPPAPAGSGAPPTPTPAPADAPGAPAPPPEPTADAGALRKTCTDAMNADPSFAVKIVEIADANAAQKRLALDLAQHETAAKAVAKNQKHVILAYAAMWLVAVAFVLFLWLRQQALRQEIAQLRADLDAATKDGK
jgi:hypothetical protein